MRYLIAIFLIIMGVSYFNDPAFFNEVAESVGSESRAPLKPSRWDSVKHLPADHPERLAYNCSVNVNLECGKPEPEKPLNEHNIFENASGFEGMGQIIPNELIRLNAELNFYNELNTPCCYD